MIGLNLIREGEVFHGSTTLTFGITDVTETKAYLEVNNVITCEINVKLGIAKITRARRHKILMETSCCLLKIFAFLYIRIHD